MFSNTLVRSFLQVLGLSTMALFLMTASPKAAAVFDECDDQFGACQEKCGTWEWSWDGVSQDYWCDLCPNSQCPNGVCPPGSGQVPWIPCACGWYARFEWHPSYHIDYFECVPGGNHGICMCSF
jgi:hypothetical protein